MEEQFIKIPYKILTQRNLSKGAKLLYGLILSLSQYDKSCFATNKYLAEQLVVSSKSISNYLKELKQLDLIKCDVDFRRIRKIYLNNSVKDY